MIRNTICACLLVLVGVACKAEATKACNGTVSFHVAGPGVAWLTCDAGLRGIEGEGILYDITSRDDDPTAPAVPIQSIVTIRLQPSKVTNSALFYARVDFAVPLAGAKQYVLRVAPGAYAAGSVKGITNVLDGPMSSPIPVPPGSGWAPLFIAFSTTPSAVLTNTSQPLDLCASFPGSSDFTFRT